jgi:hypothetical protein
MSEVSKKSYAIQEKPAVNAATKARSMLIDLSGPRGWNDTRESWLEKGARRASLTLRRARAIFYNEKLKLSADEYLNIEAAYNAAQVALGQAELLARNAAALAGAAAHQESHQKILDRTKAVAAGYRAATARPAVRDD